MRTLVRTIALVAGLLILSVTASQPPPRGVPPHKASFYRPDQDFICLDGSASVVFSEVNDNYCDCADGSDEPGTNACNNMKFYCPNVGFKARMVTSKWVNDGVCDCCDGSDEWDGHTACQNTCRELGAEAKEQAERTRAVAEHGLKVKEEYKTLYTKAVVDEKAKLEQLRADRQHKELLQREKEDAHKALEQPAEDARARHQARWDEAKAARMREIAIAAFNELDTDGDGQLSLSEIQAHPEFDADSDGTVSDAEVLEHLEDTVPCSLDHFLEKVWPNIKSIYKSAADRAAEADDAAVEGQLEGEADDEEEKDEELDPDEELDREMGMTDEEDLHVTPPTPSTYNHATPKPLEAEAPEPEMDSADREAIDAADTARRELDDAKSELNNLDGDIVEASAFLDSNFGPDGVYYGLKAVGCIDFEEQQYVYSVCPFDRVEQKPKNGGAATDLGKFEKWLNEGFSEMMYNNGQSCWNGPNRNTKVVISCLNENKILHVSEPNRCEYVMKLGTPAACDSVSSPEDLEAKWAEPLHDEF